MSSRAAWCCEYVGCLQLNPPPLRRLAEDMVRRLLGVAPPPGGFGVAEEEDMFSPDAGRPIFPPLRAFLRVLAIRQAAVPMLVWSDGALHSELLRSPAAPPTSLSWPPGTRPAPRSALSKRLPSR